MLTISLEKEARVLQMGINRAQSGISTLDRFCRCTSSLALNTMPRTKTRVWRMYLKSSAENEPSMDEVDGTLLSRRTAECPSSFQRRSGWESDEKKMLRTRLRSTHSGFRRLSCEIPSHREAKLASEIMCYMLSIRQVNCAFIFWEIIAVSRRLYPGLFRD